ncbi:MAG: tetratricopeptide repeat protein [Akkermansiaceae bacterium]
MRNEVLPYFLSGSLAILSLSLISSCGNNPNELLISSEAPISQGMAEANTALAEARGYQQAGKTKKAISAYSKIGKNYPYSTAAAEARFAEATLLDQQGDLFDAFEAYQDLISTHPSSQHYAASIKRQETIAHSVADGLITNNFLGLKTKISPSKTIKMLSNVRDNAPSAVSASRAQLAIGRVLQKSNDSASAIEAYQKIAINYANSKEAPEALFQTGEILMTKAEKGNHNKANVNRARDIYQNLITRYPNHPRSKDARNRVKSLRSDDIQRSYDTAEFYRKKGKDKSAIFYYNEVIAKTKSGTLYDQSKQRIMELGQQ